MFSRKIEIRAKELEDKLDEHPLIVDVREPDEYSSGHISGAINVPLGEVDNYRPEQEVYLVCHSGRRSRAAALILQHKGFEAKSMAGGMLEWEGPIEEDK
ncbi:rhodanese-like domain-containing protein [Breznakia pachnodae]|jgi:rhodanese-related sulfurtransferase|uniref:Rhodanese-related sulfurtransferase n=1 Tax=Breznakia pachnodae TaxID=265178 RepID=A0ABU0E6K7_9FIRM|nr:rhodanese-like domain-containing protein [Breznakia pachnodae]MDQ0362344.1 rhodanese-related sulfurtransferase [Breznakia pachnodae]